MTQHNTRILERILNDDQIKDIAEQFSKHCNTVTRLKNKYETTWSIAVTKRTENCAHLGIICSDGHVLPPIYIGVNIHVKKYKNIQFFLILDN
ncbi:Hypothetical protein FKW44_009232, partial [Caligus rogercresseyi]